MTANEARALQRGGRTVTIEVAQLRYTGIVTAVAAEPALMLQFRDGERMWLPLSAARVHREKAERVERAAQALEEFFADMAAGPWPSQESNAQAWRDAARIVLETAAGSTEADA